MPSKTWDDATGWAITAYHNICFSAEHVPLESLKRYLDGGCNEDVNIHRNTVEIREVELIPQYLSEHIKSDMSVDLFGHTYDAPFGISPIGLQGLMWPKTPRNIGGCRFLT